MTDALFAKIAGHMAGHMTCSTPFLYASMCGCVRGCVNTLKPKKWINCSHNSFLADKKSSEFYIMY